MILTTGQNLAASPESLHTYEQSVDQPNDEYSSRYGGIIQTDNPMSDVGVFLKFLICNYSFSGVRAMS